MISGYSDGALERVIQGKTTDLPGYLAAYSLTELMLDCGKLLWYDNILADDGGLGLLAWAEKERLIRERYSQYFKDDPNRLLRKFVSVLEGSKILRRFTIADRLAEKDRDLTSLLNKVDSEDPFFSRGEEAKDRIDRFNRMLAYSASFHRPFYDTVRYKHIYKHKMMKPSLVVSLALWRDKPSLLQSDGLEKRLEEVDRKIGELEPKPQSGISTYEGSLPVPPKKITTEADVEKVVADILEHKDKSDALKNVKEKFAASTANIFTNVSEEAENANAELQKQLLEAREEISRFAGAKNAVMLGSGLVSLAAIIFQPLQIGSLIGTSLFVGTGLSELVSRKKYGWLYYLDDLNIL